MTFPAHVLRFAEELRAEGVAIGTSELNDAFAALGEVGWTERVPFREALAATIAKSPEDRRVFDLVFERFFFRAAEAAALEQGVRERAGAEGEEQPDGMEGGERIDFDALREQVLRAIREENDAAMRDLARLAIAAFGRRGQGSGVLGVDVQRIRRSLGLKTPSPARSARTRPASSRSRSRATRSAASSSTCGASSSGCRSSARRRSRPRGRSTSWTARCRPARCRTSRPSTASSCSSSAGSRPRGTRRAGTAGTHRSTCGARCAPRCRPAACPSSCATSRGARAGPSSTCSATSPRASRRPPCSSCRVLHALHDSFRKMRSFVFVERISEVTDVFERERSFKAVSDAISKDAGVADVSGYTDYGRVWREFLALVEDDLHPRATVIVLGDARTNGRDPAAAPVRRRRRARGPHVLAQPRAAAVLELRRLGDLRLRALLRGLRVLDDAPARGLREGAHAPGSRLTR